MAIAEKRLSGVKTTLTSDTILTVPANTSVTILSIILNNQAGASNDVQVSIDVLGAGTLSYVYNNPSLANDTGVYVDSRIILIATDKIVISNTAQPLHYTISYIERS
jgi:hypothetical protein